MFSSPHKGEGSGDKTSERGANEPADLRLSAAKLEKFERLRAAIEPGVDSRVHNRDEIVDALARLVRDDESVLDIDLSAPDAISQLANRMGAYLSSEEE